jgi:hypothetical protein
MDLSYHFTSVVVRLCTYLVLQRLLVYWDAGLLVSPLSPYFEPAAATAAVPMGTGSPHRVICLTCTNFGGAELQLL